MMEQNRSTGFSNLPEQCVSIILSFTTPSDVCRSSSLSSLFRSAADSDYVWEKMLPSDYVEILARSDFPGLELLSKKDLYFRLCSPILIDLGRQCFWLERSTGKKCYMVSARELAIVWGDDERYWNWDTLPESRFQEVAMLVQVCWFEISCKIKLSILSPQTQYVALLVFKHIDYPHGFDECPPVEITLSCRGHVSRRNACLHRDSPEPAGRNIRRLGQRRNRRGRVSRTSATECAYLKQRDPNDGWAEVEMGEFSTEEGDEDEVEIRLLEIKGGNWKGGIAIEGIELRPKRSGNQV